MTTRLYCRDPVDVIVDAGSQSVAMTDSATGGTAIDGTDDESRTFATAAGADEQIVSVTNTVSNGDAEQDYLWRGTYELPASGTIASQTWTLAAMVRAQDSVNSYLGVSLYVWDALGGLVGFIYDDATSLGSQWETPEHGRVVTFSGDEIEVTAGQYLVLEVWRSTDLAQSGSPDTGSNSFHYNGDTVFGDGDTTDGPASYLEGTIPVGGGPATISGAAHLTGTGSATIAGKHTAFASAALTGTGSSTIAGRRVRLGTAALTGTGSATVAGVRTRFGAAALTGTGSSTVSGGILVRGAAALTGAGSMTVAGRRVRFGAAALAGTGSATVAGVRAAVGVAHLTGAGTASATGTLTGRSSAALTGVGSLTAVGSRRFRGAAALTGRGTLVVRETAAFTALTFFLPLLDTAFIHSADRFREMYDQHGNLVRTNAGKGKWRGFTRVYHGIDANQKGGITIDGVDYLGGRWNGPLTAAQIASLTTAGLAARLVTVSEPGHLPAGLD